MLVYRRSVKHHYKLTYKVEDPRLEPGIPPKISVLTKSVLPVVLGRTDKVLPPHKIMLLSWETCIQDVSVLKTFSNVLLLLKA